MDDEINVVEHVPLAFGGAGVPVGGHGGRFEAELLGDFVGKRAQMGGVQAGAQDHVVGDAGDIGDMQNDDILALLAVEDGADFFHAGAERGCGGFGARSFFDGGFFRCRLLCGGRFFRRGFLGGFGGGGFLGCGFRSFHRYK